MKTATKKTTAPRTATGINGWLVVCRGQADDVPLKMFATHKDATEYVHTSDIWQEVRKASNRIEGREEDSDMFGSWGLQTFVAVCIIPFIDGAPGDCEWIDDEELHLDGFDGENIRNPEHVVGAECRRKE